MKFFVARGDEVRRKLAGSPAYYKFPKYYRMFFGFSKILVFCIASDNDIAGASGIVSLSNYMAIYVREEYRRERLGPLLYKKLVETARNQNLSFILGSASTLNPPMLYFLRSILGFKEIVRLEKSKYDILMLPLAYRGEILYAFLRAVCSILPESLVDYTIDFFMLAFNRFRMTSTRIT